MTDGSANVILPVAVIAYVVLSARAKKSSDVGKASVMGFVGLLAIYVMVAVLSLGVMPANEIAQLENPQLAGILEAAVGPWGATKEHLIRLLSGSIIPMWFFPEGLRRVLEFFPFVYLYQLPLDIYIGKYDLKEYLPRIGMQLMWLLLFFLLFQYLQQKVMKHVMVQGG